VLTAMPPRLSRMGIGNPRAPRDEELVARVRRGDVRAADELVRRHFRAAYAVALAVLRNPMDAEDACQDALVRALERIDDCRNPARFLFWMLQIVRNRARNLRAYRRVRGGPSLEEVQEPGSGDERAGVERAELRALLLRALHALSPE